MRGAGTRSVFENSPPCHAVPQADVAIRSPRHVAQVATRARLRQAIQIAGSARQSLSLIVALGWCDQWTVRSQTTNAVENVFRFVWLGDIRVGTLLHSPDAIGLVVFAADDDDRRLFCYFIGT